MQFQERLYSQAIPNQLHGLKWPSAQKLFPELTFDAKKVNMKSTGAANLNTLMTFTGLVTNAELAGDNSLHKAITMH